MENTRINANINSSIFLFAYFGGHNIFFMLSFIKF